jgi:hypothetical protein
MGQAVVTSRGLPRWRLAEAETWPRAWLLTPASSYFDAPDEEFERQYLAQLDRHGPAKIARLLERIATATSASSLLLLCHEHR